jgi:dinuclear metal center YbgI/SA1388 family protein
MKVKTVTAFLEALAPRAYQESYDNSGLLTGLPDQDVTGILVSLDCTEAVVQEAIDTHCNLIVAHHPIIFSGLKKLTGTSYVERTIIKAIRHHIAIYAIHTNLDNVHTGVNRKIAEAIGLTRLQVLRPKVGTLTKLVTFIPHTHAEGVLSALYQAGAGQLGNYKNCSFQTEGTGTFMPNEAAKPHIGSANTQETVKEIRAEVILPAYKQDDVLAALRQSHPYEEVAYYLTPLGNQNQEVGSGMLGETPSAEEPLAFLHRLKKAMNLSVIRHTRLLETPVKKVAVCGGSGAFLLPDAIQAGAQVFVTSDIKYHEFFDADNRIILADIGHYESEVLTKDLLVALLTQKFPTFAVNFSRTITNPISYIT